MARPELARIGASEETRNRLVGSLKSFRELLETDLRTAPLAFSLPDGVSREQAAALSDAVTRDV